MPVIQYILTVARPDEIDADTLAEIEEGAEPHDGTLDAKVGRWLGGFANEAAHKFSEQLPEGWRAAIDSID